MALKPATYPKLKLTEFAHRFERNKKREDLQQFEELKKKGVIDDSDEDDESSDDEEDIVNDTTKQDLKFFDALIKVRNKDPSLKSEDAKLFDSDEEEDDDVNDVGGEFDPEEYDRKMKKVFGDGFYKADDIEPDFGSDEEDGKLKKPNFDEEDDLLWLPKGWDDEYGSNEGFLTTREKTLTKKIKVNNEKDEERLQGEEQKRKIYELEKELIKKELDEYLKLDCEGTIGDLRTRFRYKPVNKNTYGLKAKEILIVDEKELNQLVPLKKLAPYREDEFIVPHRKIKEHKQRIKYLLRGKPVDGLMNGSKKSKYDVDQAETEKEKLKAETEKSKSDVETEKSKADAGNDQKD
ncbi:hypothetical protein R6Q57_015899 [Mikania cordata]